MSEPFIKLIRSEAAAELLRHPREFALLTLIAYRAKRTSSFSAMGLEPGEALIGDHTAAGLTRRQYRTAIQNLSKWGFSTFKPTNKGTIARLTNSNIYDINPEENDQQPDQQAASNRPAGDQQPATNKNERMKECKRMEDEIPPKPPIDYPCWLNRALWEEFKAHRKAIGRPLKTVKAEQLNLNRLRKLVSQGFSQQEIIDTAIERGWQSLFEPENKGNKKAEQRTRNNLAAMAQAQKILFGEQR